MPDQSVLSQMGSSYSPVFSGVPYQPNLGFNAMPFGATPAAAILIPTMAGVMQKMGMSPMGLSDRNIFDTLQNQRFFQFQQEAQRKAAELDRQSWVNSMRGLAYMTGTPWGADQRQAARNLSDSMVSASPLLNMIAPELMDEMAGYRGSASVMAGHMMLASRYRIDPVTGALGQDPKQVAEQAKALFNSLYAHGDMAEMQGVGAGQLGGVYEELSKRGLLGGSNLTPAEGIQRLATTDPAFLVAIAKTQGVQLPHGPNAALEGVAGAFGAKNLLPMNTQRMSATDMDKLTMDDSVADKLRAFDAEKTKRSLKAYLGAVNAIRDVFGDMGKPNAPMSELFNALEAMSNGAMSQISPDKLSTMVRMTNQLATVTGVGMDNAMIMQSHLSQQASQMGLEPVFAVAANQGAMAFGAAYKNRNLPPAWGALSPDEMTQLNGQLRLNAAASQAAQRVGLAVRLDRSLHFDPGSDASKYVEALKTSEDTGATEWVDNAGKTHSLNLNRADFTKLMTGTGKVSADELNVLLGQRFQNREPVNEFNLGNTIQRTQRQNEVQPWLGAQLQGAFRSELTRQLMAAGVDQTTASKMALTGFTRGQARSAAADIMSIDDQEFRDPEARDAAIGKIMQTYLGSSTAGQAIQAKLGGKVNYSVAAEEFYGDWDRASQVQFHMHAQAQKDAFSEKTNISSASIIAQQKMEADIRNVTAPLYRGTMLRRVMGYIQNLDDTGNPDEIWLKGVGTAIGGVDSAVVRGQLVKPMQELKAQETALHKMQQDILNEFDPTRKKALQRQYQTQLETLKKTTTDLQSTFGRLGGVTDSDLSHETSLASAFLNKQENFSEQLHDIMKPGADGMPPDAVEVHRRFNEFWQSKSGDTFADAVQHQGTSAADLAAKLLSSKTAMERFGLEGIEQAKTIQDANKKLMVLAAANTGGDIAKLAAGDLDPSMSPKDRANVIAQVEAAQEQRNNAVRSLHSMQQATGRAWGKDVTSINDIAKSLGVDTALVSTAAAMTNDEVTKIERIKELRERGETRTSREKDELARLESATGKNLDSFMKADVVFAKLRKRGEDAMAYDQQSSDTTAKNFLKAYGVDVIETDDNRKALTELGGMLHTQPGEALYYGLTSGQAYLASVAKRGGIKTGKDVDAVDAVYSDYAKVQNAKPAVQQKAETDFRQRYGLKDDTEYMRFQQAMKLQTETGMVSFGEGTTDKGIRTGGHTIDQARDLIGMMLTAGKAEGHKDQNINVNVNEVRITGGELTLKGNGKADVTATAHVTATTNAAGVNHAPTQQGGR